MISHIRFFYVSAKVQIVKMKRERRQKKRSNIGLSRQGNKSQELRHPRPQGLAETYCTCSKSALADKIETTSFLSENVVERLF